MPALLAPPNVNEALLVLAPKVNILDEAALEGAALFDVELVSVLLLDPNENGATAAEVLFEFKELLKENPPVAAGLLVSLVAALPNMLPLFALVVD